MGVILIESTIDLYDPLVADSNLVKYFVVMKVLEDISMGSRRTCWYSRTDQGLMSERYRPDPVLANILWNFSNMKPAAAS